MKTKDLVGVAISFGVLFASAWVVSKGWKRGQQNNLSSFNGDTGHGIGLGATSGMKASATRPSRVGGFKQGCCSTPCSENWNNNTITNLEDLGNCLRIRCNLK